MTRPTDPEVIAAAIRLIQAEEGWRDRAYRCTAGVWSIGWGRTEAVRPGDTTTRERERPWLEARVQRCAHEVATAAPPGLELPAQCWIAIISWTYNVADPDAPGAAWRHSAVWSALRAGALEQVDDVLVRWVRRADPDTGRRVVDHGLVARRAREAALWNAGLAELAAAGAGQPEPTRAPVLAEDDGSVLGTDTVKGSAAATLATAVGGAVTTVAPQLWGIDWRVAVAAIGAVAVAAMVGVLLWRARRV